MKNKTGLLVVLMLAVFLIPVDAYTYDLSSKVFDGNDIVRIDDSTLKGLEGFNLTVDIKFTKARHSYIVFKDRNFLLQTAGSPIKFQFGFYYNGNWTPIMYSKTQVKANKSYLINVVYNNETNAVEMYVNRKLEKQVNISETPDTGKSVLYFGNRKQMDRALYGVIKYVKLDKHIIKERVVNTTENTTIPPEQNTTVNITNISNSVKYSCNGQVFDYDDVLVVTNANSEAGKELSSYFIEKRNISHQLMITTSTSEEIDYSTYYNEIRIPIESYLNSTGLANKINYIVLTKGVPIKVRDCKWQFCGRSVDSLITGIYTDRESKNGITTVYIKQANVTNIKSSYDIYYVTRLDGRTLEDAKKLITATVCNELKGTVVLDSNPTKSGGYEYWNTELGLTATLLREKNISVLYDNTTDFLINLPDTAAYYSWGSNDKGSNNPISNSSAWNITFTEGSLADTAVSTSARTMVGYWTLGSQSLIADLIHMGVSGVKGYAYEPFLACVSYPIDVLGSYYSGNNLAQSFYRGSSCISWMDIVIGDPKIMVKMQ